MDCIFCKIIAGKIPTEKIYEDDVVFAFLDINPVNEGHLLVIPKEHHQWFTDLPEDILSHLYTKAQTLHTALIRALDADYVAHSVVGIDVPHFHLHLIPRWHGDGLAGFWPTKEYEEGRAKEIGTKLHSALE